MLAYSSVTGDLANLLKSFIKQRGLELPELWQELNQYQANSRMPFVDWWRYLAELRQVCDEPEVGLLIGLEVQPADAGVLGYIAASCDTILEALINFQRYQKLLYEGDLAKIELLGDSVRFYWPAEYGPSSKESDEVLVSGILAFFRNLFQDQSITPISVDFINPAPQSMRLYDEILACQVNFLQAENGMTFGAELLSLKIPQADQGLNQLLQRQADSLLASQQLHNDYLQQVRVEILKQLPLGQAQIDVVAQALKLSPRTLNRRLAQHNASFKDLLTEVRYHQACDYLRENKFSHSEIALLLGYSEQSAFSRAFKQWSGKTPLQFQKINS